MKKRLDKQIKIPYLINMRNKERETNPLQKLLIQRKETRKEELEKLKLAVKYYENLALKAKSKRAYNKNIKRKFECLDLISKMREKGE